MTTPLYSLGAKLLVMCAGPRQLRTNWQQFLAPLTPNCISYESYGEKPWYIRGKFVAILHLKPSTWGNQRGARSHQECVGQGVGPTLGAKPKGETPLP